MHTHLRSVDLNLLVVLDAILEEHSLSAAAKRLNMTQPAVSNALARLRNTFKDQLFVRTRYGMEPTPRGLELIQPIKQALSIIQETVDHRNIFDPASSNRTFHIALNDQGEEQLLPRLLKLMQRQGSAIKIESHPFFIDDVKERLLTNRLDFSFDHLQPEDERIGFSQLALDSLVVIASKNHPRISTKISLKEFYAENHVILKHRRGKKTMLDSLVGEKISTRKLLAEVQNFNSLLQIVSKTDAIGVVSASVGYSFKSTLGLKVLPLPFNAKPFPYYLLWSKAKETDRGYQWFKNQILSFKS